jgi:eukaryotic-like serine/threonine-protein kinase
MPSTAPPSTVDRAAFLAGLRSSGVIAESGLAAVLDGLPPFARNSREVAEHLVADGTLTRFQAERLLVGRNDGFALGPYVILDHLGKSATGRVFKARHRTMNRLAAIKVLAPELTANDEVRDAIRAEARTAAKLTHPNLVTLLDVNQAGDRMYFVKEYLDGAAVDAVLREGGRLSVGQAGDVIRQAALGLQHAHEKGMAHGRVSPSAILIGKSGRHGVADRPPVKVSGFGLGRFAAEGDAHASDFEYRAPEQFADPELTSPAADVYSLGCVLFHLLAGQPPFPAASPREAGHGHRTQPAPPVAYYRPEVPAAVAALLAAMLAKDPAARPPAEEVALRLGLYSDAVTPDKIDLNFPAASYCAATSILQPQSAVVRRPPAGPSPFAAMTVGADPHEPTPVSVPTDKSKAKRRPERRRPAPRGAARVHPLTATSIILLIALGVAFALVLMMKRAIPTG